MFLVSIALPLPKLVSILNVIGIQVTAKLWVELVGKQVVNL